jgi:predicted MFS family arabinose efflux permease
LNLFDATAVAVSSVAPAYSLAATVAAVALVLSGVLTRVVLSPDLMAAGGRRGDWRTALQRHALGLLAHAPVRQVFVPQFLFTLGLTAFYEFYPVWLVEVTGMDTRGIAWVTAILCLVMSSASVLAGRLRPQVPLASSALAALLAAGCFLAVALAGARLGLVAIIAAGLPISIYNALVQAEVSRRFGDTHGQGAIMGLVSTVFCIANLVAALIGSLIAVIDTRAILALGATCSVVAGLRLGWLARVDQSACVTSTKSGSSA